MLRLATLPTSSTQFRFVLATVTLLLSVGLRPATADDAADLKALGVTAKQALKMGSDKFYKRWCERKPTSNPRFAMHLYSDLRRKDNAHRSSTLSSTQRKKLEEFRSALEEWEGGAHAIAYARSGGGTMHLDFAADREASREDLLGELIPLLGSQSKSPKSRTACDKAIAEANVATAKFKELRGQVKPGEYTKIFDDGVTKWKSGIRKLKISAANLPDAAVGKVTARVKQITSDAIVWSD
jgi:hypothetical protein